MTEELMDDGSLTPSEKQKISDNLQKKGIITNAQELIEQAGKLIPLARDSDKIINDIL